jgi:CubicO group peptidase (beta-lactamase class C family)
VLAAGAGQTAAAAQSTGAKPAGEQAAAPTAGAAPRTLNELQTRLEQVLRDTRTPGLGLALVTPGGPPWVATLGAADVDGEKPVTPGTLFRAGSISKSFVALAALILQEEGKLSLDARLASLAPEVEFSNPWEERDPVRLAHLLEHTSGFDDIHLHEFAVSDPAISLRQALAYDPRPRAARWRPGTRYSYSNAGPAVAGYVIEKASGQPFEDFVERRLFGPLGMSGASFHLTPEVLERLAKGYGDDGRTEIPHTHILDRPSGSLAVTPADLARLVQLLLQRGAWRGQALLRPESIERMERPRTTLAARLGMSTGYGLGNFTSVEDGFVLQGHDGGIDGFLSSYGYMIESGRGYVFMINAMDGEAFERIGALVRSYLTSDLRRPASAAAPAPFLAPFVGIYEPIAPRDEITRFIERILSILRVRADGGALSVRSLLGEGKRYVPAGGAFLRREDAPVPTAALIEGEPEGTLLQFTDSGGTYRRIAPWQAWARSGVAAACLLLMASSALWALFWAPRAALGRVRRRPIGKPLLPRGIPALAALCLFTAFGLVIVLGNDPMFLQLFGRRTGWSIAFCALTWAFAAGALAGAVVAARALPAPRARGERLAIRLHSLAAAAANLVVAAYLGWWGVIGLRTWDY